VFRVFITHLESLVSSSKYTINLCVIIIIRIILYYLNNSQEKLSIIGLFIFIIYDTLFKLLEITEHYNTSFCAIEVGIKFGLYRLSYVLFILIVLLIHITHLNEITRLNLFKLLNLNNLLY